MVQILGTSGSDTINASGLNGNNNPAQTPGAGNDQLFGLVGDDVLSGLGGADQLDGGEGFDIASYTTALAGITIDLRILKGTGGDANDDTYFSIEGIYGSSHDDIITTNIIGMLVLGGGGNDIISSNINTNGNDSFLGGEGADSLDGSRGDDLLNGGAGGDSLYGGDGTDTATYFHASTAVLADLQSPGFNTGEASGDSYSSIERLTGGDFNDSLYGNGGTNTLDGRDGNDYLVGRGFGDALIGGAGIDTASYWTAATGVIVDLGNLANNTGDAVFDTYSSIEIIEGSFLNDIMTGDGSANTFLGSSGNDRLAGGGGADILRGEDFDDELMGGAGGDVLDGGNGTDMATYHNAVAGLIVDLLSPSNNTGEAQFDTYSSIENLQGSANSDVLRGDNGANSIGGWTGGNDQISGRGGADLLAGGTGDDQLNGGLGGRSTVRRQWRGPRILCRCYEESRRQSRGPQWQFRRSKGRHLFQHRESSRLGFQRQAGG